MKKRIILFVLACSSLSTIAGGINTQLVITTADSSRVVYALNQYPTLTFSNGNVIIATPTTSTSYLLSTIAYFSYENLNNTSVKPNTQKEIIITDEMITIPELMENSSAALYSIDGRTIMQESVGNNGDYSLSLSNLQSGKYLIVVNGITYKFIKK